MQNEGKNEAKGKMYELRENGKKQRRQNIAL